MACLGRQFNLVTLQYQYNERLGRKREASEGNLIINDSIYNIHVIQFHNLSYIHVYVHNGRLAGLLSKIMVWWFLVTQLNLRHFMSIHTLCQSLLKVVQSSVSWALVLIILCLISVCQLLFGKTLPCRTGTASWGGRGIICNPIDIKSLVD